MRELYEKYKGRTGYSFGRTGKICGYSDNGLIMAVLDGSGWDLEPEKYSMYSINLEANGVDINSFNGFFSIEERHIDKSFKFGR